MKAIFAGNFLNFEAVKQNSAASLHLNFPIVVFLIWSGLVFLYVVTIAFSTFTNKSKFRSNSSSSNNSGGYGGCGGCGGCGGGCGGCGGGG